MRIMIYFFKDTVWFGPHCSIYKYVQSMGREAKCPVCVEKRSPTHVGPKTTTFFFFQLELLFMLLAKWNFHKLLI